MKILICAHTYLPDVNGVAQAVNFQYKLLLELGHHVDIVASNNDRDFPEIVRSFKISGTGRLFDKFSGQIDEYLNFLENSEYDLIFFHCWETWVTELPLLLKKSNFKKVIFSHGTSHTIKINNAKNFLRRLIFLPFSRSFTKRMRFFDHYVFLTNYGNSDRFMDKLFFDNNKLNNYSVIPNIAIYHSEIIKGKFLKNFSLPCKKIVLCVSNFSKSKGQDIVLKAFKEINPDNYILVFIGSVENSFSIKLKQDAKRLLNKSVFFLSGLARDDIYQAYVDSDFFVFCSQTEAQPLVILDSIASKLPFISSDVGCISEIKGGVVYKSYEDLKNKMNLFFDDELLKARLSKAGFDDFVENYSFETVKNKYSILLNRLIK
jgi:glycosyltransferase involved in cell wall biosynthesis